MIHRRLVYHAVLWTTTVSKGIFHVVLYKQLPFQLVSISQAFLCTDTVSGSLYLMLYYVQTLYQEVCISWCVKYTVIIPEVKHLSCCVQYTVTLSGCKHLTPCLILRWLVSHAVLWKVTISEGNCNCNCNLFAVHTSKIGYSPVDIDIVIYILSNVMYKYNENTIIEY